MPNSEVYRKHKACVTALIFFFVPYLTPVQASWLFTILSFYYTNPALSKLASFEKLFSHQTVSFRRTKIS